jgi:hypothetical protein
MHSLSEMDAQIAALEVQLRQLKSQRNRMIRICCLPSEILTRIFEDLQGRRNPHILLTQIVDTRWSRVMGVCRHFRSIALGEPCLWNVMDAMTPFCTAGTQRWVDLCLTRSNIAPLHIFTTTTRATRYISRAQTAFIRSDDYTRTDVFDLPAPHLQSLSTVAASYDISSSFLGGINTSLAELSVNGHTCIVYLHDRPFTPSLRRLTLFAVTIASGFDLLADFFEHLTYLEELNINHIVFQASSPLRNHHTVIPISKRIHLSYLKRLIIHDILQHASALLRLVSTPTTQLQIMTSDDADEILDGGSNDCDNHLPIYEAFSSFCRQSLQLAGPCSGQMILDCNLDIEPQLGVVEFKSDIHDLPGDFAEWSLLDYLDYQLVGTHPLLSHIATLRLRPKDGGDRGDWQMPSIDETLGARFLPAVENLVLQGFELPVDLEPVHEWLSARKGQIKRIELVNCERAIKELANEFPFDIELVVREEE